MKGVNNMEFTRINKRQARKLYEQHKEFWIAAVNMRPCTGLLIGSPSYNSYEMTFEQLVNSFTYYNCNNECGRYPAFYLS